MRNILFPIFLFLLFHLQGTGYGQIIATIIGGTDEVCMGDSVALFLSFSGGVAPWNAVVNDKDGEFQVLDSVPAAYTLWIKPGVDNTYTIATVEDSQGTPGDPLGEADIVVRQSTPVTIEMDRMAFLPGESGIALVSSPPGGEFKGAGVAGSSFYPGIATAVGSPHEIICTFTNEFGCISKDAIDLYVLSEVASVFLVSGGDTINAICNDGATYSLLGSNEDNIPGVFELVDASTREVITGKITDEDLFDDEAILDPVGLSGGYDIVYTYGMGEAIVQSTYRFYVNDLGSIKILNLPDTVCINDAPILLLPEAIGDDPGATFVFDGPGVNGNQLEGYYYDPASSDVSLGQNELSMNFTSSNGCKTMTTQVVYNSYTPKVDFTLSDGCLPGDGGTVLFTNLTDEKDSVASWSWDFGNPESGPDNRSKLENPAHFYRDPGPREITLTATTFDGCVARKSLDTLLADLPAADFISLSSCYIMEKPTSFLDRSVSGFSVIDSLVWTFKNSSGEVLDVIGSNNASDTVKYLLNSMDTYQIELSVINELGCRGDVSKAFSLQSTLSLSEGPYEEDFNGRGEEWLVRSADQLESWVLDVPDFEGFEQVPGNMAWHTRLPVNASNYLERSWVQSPCFDFTGVEMPLVQLEVMRSFVPGIDGAVLQYQDLASEGWKTIGNVGEGLNWYNEWGIFNEPGGSSFGWGLLPPFEPDRQWVKASYPLDMLVGKPHVIFRLAIATGSAIEVLPGKVNQGFAFDNFFLGERHRYSLLEHFTNSASEAAEAADDIVDAFSVTHSENVITLQYHVDYPGEDDMNRNNPFPSSTRAFNYGVQDVPYAVLNGGVKPETRFDFTDPANEPGEMALKMESLEIPLFDVGLRVDYLENSLAATVRVTCIADTFASNVQLYLVVVEREVTAYTGLNQDTVFKNVVLDMLPSPAGKLLGGQWNRGRLETFTYSWDYADYVEDVADLSVVAFVQDRDNGTVLQAEAIPHTPGVGIKLNRLLSDSFAVYPNPAADLLYVQVGDASIAGGELTVVDFSGRVVMRHAMHPDSRLYRLDISRLSSGIYSICWMESGQLRGRKKLVCTR